MMKTAADATTETETETTLDTNEPVTPPHVFITSFFFSYSLPSPRRRAVICVCAHYGDISWGGEDGRLAFSERKGKEMGTKHRIHAYHTTQHTFFITTSHAFPLFLHFVDDFLFGCCG